MNITSGSKVEVGLLISIIAGLVWILTHILPTEAKVESHEQKIGKIEEKVDIIMADTQYIRGNLDGRKRK